MNDGHDCELTDVTKMSTKALVEGLVKIRDEVKPKDRIEGLRAKYNEYLDELFQRHVVKPARQNLGIAYVGGGAGLPGVTGQGSTCETDSSS